MSFVLFTFYIFANFCHFIVVIMENRTTITEKLAAVFRELTGLNDLWGTRSRKDPARVKVLLRTLEYNDRLIRQLQQDAIGINASTATKELKVPDNAFDATLVLINALFEIAYEAEDKNNSVSRSSVSLPLPDVKIPGFEGKIEDWSEFKELFDAVIDTNENLSNMQKFSYLRSLLKNEPLTIITAYEFQPGNYGTAYEALCQRYESSRRKASFHVKGLLKQHLTSKDVPSTLEAIRAAVTNVKKVAADDLGDYLLFELCYNACDDSIQQSFDQANSSANELPTTAKFVKHLESMARTQELRKDGRPKSAVVTPKKKEEKRVFLATEEDDDDVVLLSSEVTICTYCDSKAHSIYACEKFSNLSSSERLAVVKERRFCFNCLGNHNAKMCRSKSVCRTCKRRHHSSLHQGFSLEHSSSSTPQAKPAPAAAPVVPASDPPQSSSTQADPPTVATLIATEMATVLLATIACRIKDDFGVLHEATVLLDMGSQVNLVTSALVEKLGLKIRNKKKGRNVVGIADVGVQPIGTVDVALHPHDSLETRYSCSASVMKSICSKLPSVSLEQGALRKFRELRLADPKACEQKSIDMLLGATAFADLMSTDTPNLLKGQPTAMKTTFGWVLLGAMPDPKPVEPPVVLLAHIQEDEDLNEVLLKFWELEDCPHGVSEVNPEHAAAELHFQKTHRRLEDGTFCVRLPFKANAKPETLENRAAAFRATQNLERRLNRLSDDVRARYNSFMQELLDLDHMRLAPAPSKYVLPHLLVHKEDSSSTKTRAVFHASHKGITGESLNDLLLTGGKLQKDIADILMNFRFHRVALTADIKMMYRMIKIHEDDLKYQHIFWKPPNAAEIQEFELLRLVYGMTPSSFLAQRSLLQVKEDDGAAYPNAARVLEEDTYMDDIVTGVSSVGKAVQLREELTQLLMAGGFPLRKWGSSHPEVLESLPAEHVEKYQEFDSGETGIKVLGLCWIPDSDCFGYQVRPFQGENTKRSVLSLIAKLYDPVGFLQPVIIIAKIMIQKLWLAKVQWDDPLPPEIAAEWSRFGEMLPQLADVRIPRYMGTEEGLIRLVGFCDASESAYAAVVYVQVSQADGTFTAHVLTAKSRVAPLKKQSIPRLELLGALLLSRLVRAVKENMGCAKFASIHLFCDSTVALAWIATPPHNLKTYVAHRVLEIQENTQDDVWNHCTTDLNPADCASRGVMPDSMAQHPQWWNGPDFLSKDVCDWPTGRPDIPTDIPEFKVPVMVSVVEPPAENDLFLLIEKSSNLLRLKRIVAYVLRYVDRFKKPKELRIGPLTSQELKIAMQACLKITQAHEFPQELKNNFSSKRVIKLSPFLDEEGMLRVGGRLSRSSLPERSKHPILLSKTCNLARLICDFYHTDLLHAGLLVTMTEIQRTYWIISLRSLVKKRIRECVSCFRVNMKPGEVYMADLPPYRVTASRVFNNVGTDFAGPLMVKTSTLRSAKKVKAYICLFICMATTACHLELVSDLSTDAFLAAFTRFVSRRGLPTDVFSDCGRNYIGAEGRLVEIQKFLEANSDNIATAAASRNVTWHFNPPLGSHHGGLWESNIKTIKQLLYRQIGATVLTFEETSTLLARIEAVLNSRPLEFSSDPNDGWDYLTPGHFLIGSSMQALPELPIDENSTPRQRWDRVRQITQCLWSRWSRSYLNSLMQRQKWQKDCANLTVGKLVYVQDLNTAPLLWPLGRVAAVHPGPDGRVRVVTVKVRGREFVRPITKVVPVPVA